MLTQMAITTPPSALKSFALKFLSQLLYEIFNTHSYRVTTENILCYCREKRGIFAFDFLPNFNTYATIFYLHEKKIICFAFLTELNVKQVMITVTISYSKNDIHCTKNKLWTKKYT